MKYLYTCATIILAISCSCSHYVNENQSLKYDTLHISNSRYEVYTMKDKVKYGVMAIYDTNWGGKVEERFYLDDRPIVYKTLSADTTCYAFSHSYNINDSIFPIGFLWYYIEPDQKIQVQCTYFEVFAKKNISLNDKLAVKVIGNLGNFKDFQLKLTLGELDSELNLRNIDTVFSSKTNELEFQISEISEGINIITGLLEYYDGDKNLTNMFMASKVRIPYIFYLQFNVTKPN